MEELLKSLSKYNILNYFVPGVVFAVLADATAGTNLVQQDLIVGLVLYYVIGMVISRVGSLLLEPILERLKFTKPDSHERYVEASKVDELIPALSEQNNTYRTLATGLLLLIALSAYMRWGEQIVNDSAEVLIGLFALMVLFLFSYRKQTNYIVSRIREALKAQDG